MLTFEINSALSATLRLGLMSSFSFLETCFVLVGAVEKQTTRSTCCRLDSFFLMGKMTTVPHIAQLPSQVMKCWGRAGAGEHPTTWVRGQKC